MASGKVARRTVVSDVAELLDSTEVAALIAKLDDAGDNRGQKGFGRPGYRHEKKGNKKENGLSNKKQ